MDFREALQNVQEVLFFRVRDARTLDVELLHDIARHVVDCNHALEQELEILNLQIPKEAWAQFARDEEQAKKPGYAHKIMLIYETKKWEMEIGSDFDHVDEQEVETLLKQNIQYWIELPCADQHLSDAYGPLISPADYVVALRRERPVLTIFDLRRNQKEDQKWAQHVEEERVRLREERRQTPGPWNHLPPHDYAARGEEAMRQQQYTQALEEFRNGLMVDPLNIRAMVLCGSALFHLRRYEEAVSIFSKALALKPRESAALAVRGAARAELGHLEAAEQDLDTSLVLNRDLFALVTRGALMQRKGRSAEAIRDFSSALELRPGDLECLKRRGLALMAEARYIEAIQDLQALVHRAPQELWAHDEITLAKSLLTKSRIHTAEGMNANAVAARHQLMTQSHALAQMQGSIARCEELLRKPATMPGIRTPQVPGSFAMRLPAPCLAPA